VILVSVSVIGAATGILTYLTYHSIPQALLAAGAAAGGSTHLFHQLIGPDPIRYLPGQPADRERDDQQH
jgi:hypothetical protein